MGASHKHTVYDIKNLLPQLKALSESTVSGGPHTHIQGDVTGLETALSGKESANVNIQTHIASAHAPVTAQKNSDITKAEIETVLTGAITTHTHAAADPWTVVKLASDFLTSSATAVAVTGMEFAPIANKTYLIECYLFLRTATATVGPRPGVGWPTGLTDGVAFMQTTSAAGTIVLQNGNMAAAVLGPVGGLPNTTQSWPAFVSSQIISGVSPSGTWKLTLASETAGTNVTIKAGSFLMYRQI